MTTDELAELVARAHDATTLREPEDVLRLTAAPDRSSA
jgi:hypothetical protein